MISLEIMHFVLIYFLLNVSVCFGSTESEFCGKENQECSTDAKASEGEKWTKYSNEISIALREYVPCQYTNCSCYMDVISGDLKPFSTGIHRENLLSAQDHGTTLYQIVNHKLYREEKCMFLFRCKGVEHFILQIIDELPDMEFLLNSRDWPASPRYSPTLKPIFSFSKNKDYFDIMYPAWTFWEGGPAISLYPTGIGRWDLHRKSVSEAGEKIPWEKKISKAFFRGSRTSSERDPLVLLSRREPELVDAQYTKNQAWKSDKDTLGAAPAKEVSFEEHCQFKYLFNFRGVAASFRFKHLFLCKSLVFHVGDDFQEFFYSAMKPWVHYIPVDSSLSNVEELLKFVRQNDHLSRSIADRGFQFIWDHLKMDDIACYWRALLTEYAKLLKYNVKLDKSFIEVK